MRYTKVYLLDLNLRIYVVLISNIRTSGPNPPNVPEPRAAHHLRT